MTIQSGQFPNLGYVVKDGQTGGKPLCLFFSSRQRQGGCIGTEYSGSSLHLILIHPAKEKSPPLQRTKVHPAKEKSPPCGLQRKKSPPLKRKKNHATPLERKKKTPPAHPFKGRKDTPAKPGWL